MMENFADAPISITEARADKERDARRAKARDALIYVVRRIDSGDMTVDCAVIFYRESIDGGKDYKTHSSLGGGNGHHDILGLVERGKFMVLSK